MTLDYIQKVLLKLAAFFIDESQKEKLFFESYLKSDLGLLREHRKDFGENKYNNYIRLEHEQTTFYIKHSFNLNDFNRGPCLPADKIAELDEMNDTIVACKKIPRLVSCSRVQNKEAGVIIVNFFSANHDLLAYDHKKSKKTSFAIKVKSDIFCDLYFFVNLGRVGSYELEFGMFKPTFTIDVGSLMGARSVFRFDTVEKLYECLDKTEKLIVAFLPYLCSALKGDGYNAPGKLDR